MSWLRWFKKIPSALRWKRSIRGPNNSKDKLQRPIIVNSPVVPVEDALYILLLLTYSLPEVSVPQIKNDLTLTTQQRLKT